MRIIKFLIISIVLLIAPGLSYANVCDNEGITVVFVNGVFADRLSATNDKDSLRTKFLEKTKNENISFINGFNESRFSGIGDLIKSVIQAYRGASLDYDLTNILNQVHDELTTQKILLVGHSQGTFYTNAAYEYLVNHGVPAESIGVYNVATPADVVAGNGNYTTSTTDKVINEIVRELTVAGSARKPLLANVDIALSDQEKNDPMGGHSFSEVYLKAVPDKIINDIDGALTNLADSGVSAECFTPPKKGLTHNAVGIGFWFGEGFANMVLHTVMQPVVYAYNFLQSTIQYAIEHPEVLLAGLRSPGATPLEPLPNRQLIPIAQIEALEREIMSLQEDLGGASTQNTIDDILEKIDMLQRQIADREKPAAPEDTPLQENILLAKEEVPPDKQQQTYPVFTSSSTIYPKILISEVQIGSATDAKHEFVELYNLHDKEIDLTGWYLQRKTQSAANFSTFAPTNLFAGKRITANGYFLIARQGTGFAADIFVDNPLTENNTLVLKNPGGEISDKVGWGLAQDYELIATINPPAGKSIGRKMVAGQPYDDNINKEDFETGVPTPKAGNVAYVAPPPAVPTDTLAPEGVFDLAAVQKSLAFTVNFEIIDPIGVVSPSGVDSYVFRWQQAGGVWQQDLEQKVSGSLISAKLWRNFEGVDEQTYYFQVKAKDVAGNESDWQPETPATTKISLFKKILINEIQTEGKTAKDEFIELHNPNTVDINLEGFELKKKTSGGTESNLVSSGAFSGIIKAGGYFLIVPQDNADGSRNYAGEALPDLPYSGTSFTFAKDNTILLYDAEGVVLDKVGFGAAKDFEILATANHTTNKSIERKKLGIDTDNNFADFKISDEPTPRAGFPKTTLQDITDWSAKPASNMPGSPIYNFLLKWSSPSPNIDFYQVQYKVNDGAWKDWLSHASEAQAYFQGLYSLFNDNVYHFRGRAQDRDENLGDWSKEIQIDVVNPIVITEVGYAGTNADAGDQWIELYNRTDHEIDLAGWHIISGSGGVEGLNIKLEGKILAHGYFILEQGDDTVLSDISANQIFENSIGRNYLYLRDKNNRYIDELYMPGSGLDENKFLQEDNHYSVERVSAYSFGLLDKNWKVNNGQLVNGNDADGNQIFGTPGQQNSVHQLYTYYPYSFMEDTVLKKELSPYLFLGLNNHVFKDTTVQVEPGVVIKLYDRQSGLTVHGTLKAMGSEAEHIIFTSFQDDALGGDSNGDQGDSLPMAGDWLSLYFAPDSKNSQLEYIEARYGGAVMGSSPLGFGNAIWADHADMSLKNSVIQHNKNRGLMLINSNAVIDNVQFFGHNDNDWPFNEESKAIFVQGGAPHITNSHFEDNAKGIYLSLFFDLSLLTSTDTFPVIQNNTFTKNREPIILGSGAYPVFASNDLAENNFNNVVFTAEISKDITLGSDIPYLIKNMLVVPANITLTMNPATVMEFQNSSSGLQVNGTLKALGNQGEPIIFRPHNFDSETVTPGAWTGLQFSRTSQNSVLENTEISYAISGVKVDQSAVLVKNSVIQNNKNNGIWLINSPSTIDASEISEHKEVDNKGIFVQGGIPAIKNSHFINNFYGIYNETWHDPEINQDVLAEPIMENNQFEGSIEADIFPIPIVPSEEP